MTDDVQNDALEADNEADARVESSGLRLNNRKMIGFDKLPKTVEQLNNTPGAGVPIGDPVKIPIPKLPKRRSKTGKRDGKSGKPPHEPTDAMRQYVYDFMCQGGTQLICAHNLRISAPTLGKHYDYELSLAESRKDMAVDGVLLRNAIRADGNKDFQRSAEFYYKRHGKIRDHVDITSGGEAIEGNNVIIVPAVAVLPKSDDDIPE